MRKIAHNQKPGYHRQWLTFAGIILPNGAKCNIEFYAECVLRGFISMDD